MWRIENYPDSVKMLYLSMSKHFSDPLKLEKNSLRERFSSSKLAIGSFSCLLLKYLIR